MGACRTANSSPREAGGGVAGPQAVAQTIGHGLEQLVPGRMTPGVVDGLEAVEVDEEHGEELARSPHPRQRRRETVAEEKAIGKIREPVVMRHMGDARLAGPAIGHVLAYPDHEAWAPHRSLDERDLAGADVASAAVRAQHGLVLDGLDRAEPERDLVLETEGRGLLGSEHLRVRLPERLRTRASEELFAGLVVDDEAAALVHVLGEDRGRHVVDDLAQEVAGLPDLLLHAIAARCMSTTTTSIASRPSNSSRFAVTLTTLCSPAAVRCSRGAASTSGDPRRGRRRRALAGAEVHADIADGQLEERVPRMAVETDRGLVDPQDRFARGVADQHRRRIRLEQQARRTLAVGKACHIGPNADPAAACQAPILHPHAPPVGQSVLEGVVCRGEAGEPLLDPLLLTAARGRHEAVRHGGAKVVSETRAGPQRDADPVDLLEFAVPEHETVVRVEDRDRLGQGLESIFEQVNRNVGGHGRTGVDRDMRSPLGLGAG